MEIRKNADDLDGVTIEKLAKAYVDVREEMWRLLADRVGEKWQTVEAKVCHPTCDFPNVQWLTPVVDRCASAWRKASRPSKQQAT